jgi:hypothetical protein
MSFEGHPGVDPTKLRLRDAKPEVERIEISGKGVTSVMWPRQGGYSSQSPAAAPSSVDEGKAGEPSETIRATYEALELPGTISDYHFKLLAAYEALWSHRRKRPELLSELERMLLLDIELVSRHGKSLLFEPDREALMPRVPAFDKLIALYEDEGFVHEALAIAQMATAAGQNASHEARLSQRLANLEAEDRE